MTARIGKGDAVMTICDGREWIVLARWGMPGIEVVALERPDGERTAISLRGVRRLARQLPLPDAPAPVAPAAREGA